MRIFVIPSILLISAMAAVCQAGPAVVPPQKQQPLDPETTALLQRTTAAQFGSNQIRDVRLTGTVVVRQGAEHRGSITMQADSTGRSKILFELDNGNLQESSSGNDEDPTCNWADDKGTIHQVPVHNCLTDGAWFFPTISIIDSQTKGAERFTSKSDQNSSTILDRTRIPKARPRQGPKDVASLERLGTEHISIDPATQLPTSLTFTVHPDNDARVDLPVEVRFSDYREVNGVKVAFHIEKIINGTTILEINLESATFNTEAPNQTGGAQ